MKKSIPAIILIACAAAFVVGVIQLFELRFEAGDVYARYSSLRADPMGTMALYESIGKAPGVTARRDFSSENRLPEDASTTYLHLAAKQYEWRWMPEDVYQEIDGFVRRGGRLVVTLLPESADVLGKYRWQNMPSTNGAPITNSTPAAKTNSNQVLPNKPKKRGISDDETVEFRGVSLEEKWGLGFEVRSLQQGDNETYESARVQNMTDLPLPASLDWHSGIILTNLGQSWQVIYARGNKPVVAERKIGNGTVVIATDSYFVSNEAMLKDRHADFLAWLVGSSKTIVFDEAHLGTVERSGVSGLMRKYRLYWFILGLIVLAVLFIWKNSLSLAPRFVELEREEFVAGKEAATGFVNLLRRNIPLSTVLDTGYAEWKKSAAQSGKYSKARLEQAELIYAMDKSLPAKEKNPLMAYHEISKALNNRTIENGNPNPGNATNS